MVVIARPTMTVTRSTMTLLLSLIGAAFISRLINQPLSRLSSAARSVARGITPLPLPDTGPAEIREANQSFNQMVQDLNQVESDRAVILAGMWIGAVSL